MPERVVLCDYCGRPAKLITGRELYPHRTDLSFNRFWRCDPCEAHVGCHASGIGYSSVPVGRLANAGLRRAKQAAHLSFDFLWQRKIEREGFSRTKARRAAYKWLAQQLDIPYERCHIGMFDEETCTRVVQFCEPYVDKIKMAERIRNGVDA